MKAVRTTCPYCGVGCGIAASPTGPREVAIAGDKAHPANAGKLCSKGTHLGETVGLEGRLLYPMIGETRVTWDMALDDVAARLADTVANYGPDSVAFYVSGQLLTEDYYVANKLMKGFIGSGNIDTNSRLCMASAVAAHNRAFGEDLVPCTYADLDQADLIVLVGSNTAWCHPVIWQRIEAARERTGCKLVVIDPRRTETAQRADLHVAVPPDGDVALFNALLADMAARGLVDQYFLAAHCEVPEGFLAGLDAAAHGTDPATFAALADLVAAHQRMVTVFSMGANQSVCGTDKGNAFINLHLATGRIGLPGAGPFSMTGQPNAMGGREVGGLANMLACHLGFAEDERAAVRAFWNAPNLCSGPGLKAVDMFRAVHDGRIRFLWVMATNPAVSMPDAGLVREDQTLLTLRVDREHLQGVAAPQVLLARAPAAVQGDGSARQRAQALQGAPHVLLQGALDRLVAAAALLALRHPVAQALLGCGQLDEGGPDVAGDPAALDLQLGDAQGGSGAQALGHCHGGQQSQGDREATSEHRCILGGGVHALRVFIGSSCRAHRRLIVPTGPFHPGGLQSRWCRRPRRRRPTC